MAKTEFKLKGLRKYGVAVSGLLVLALTTVASAEQIPYETTLSNNGTTHSYESSYLFDLFNIFWRKSEIHYHHVWPELEFGWRLIVGSVIGFFGAAFGSVGGVGGGGIFVPVLTLIIGFDPKTSTAISKCMITGAAGATVYYCLKLRHPSLDLPIIDYDLALLFQPMLLLGISIGVALNILFAEWMVTILLIILFLGNCYFQLQFCLFCQYVFSLVVGLLAASTKAFFKGVETWRKETIIKKEAARRLTSNDAGVEEVAYKLIPGGPKNDSTFSNEVYKAKEVSIFDNMYWKDTTRLIAVWIIILFLHVSKVPAFVTFRC
uniref:Sulfite exporter TauE/SafE family protein n=1 Tax=Solanum tuberosum TaxID=4113 RepID=M0ZRI2_SOLTU